MKKFLIIFIILLIIICINIFSTSFGNEEIAVNNDIETSSPEEIYGTVTAKSLKLRSGLSIENEFIGVLSEGENVHIYGKVDNWYIVSTQNNLVGAVCADYIDCNYVQEETIETSNVPVENDYLKDINLSQDEQIFFNLINNKRLENNLPEFEIDETLLNIARLKCQDLVKNNYFSHTSPTFGTIYQMLQNNNYTYSKASENIAKGLNADTAIKNLMNSEPHKNNILSQDFNYTGIAVINNIDCGKMFVQIFIAK